VLARLWHRFNDILRRLLLLVGIVEIIIIGAGQLVLDYVHLLAEDELLAALLYLVISGPEALQLVCLKRWVFG